MTQLRSRNSLVMAQLLMRYARLGLWLTAAVVGVLPRDAALGEDSVEVPQISPLSRRVIQEQTSAWLQARGVDAAIKNAVERQLQALPPDASPVQIEQALAEIAAKSDPAINTFLSLVRDPQRAAEAVAAIQDTLQVSSKEIPVANTAAFAGRWLVQQELYDEAHDVLRHVAVESAADPAGVLFARAVCEHKLLLKPAVIATLAQLTTGVAGVPERYLTVARLMMFDWQQHEVGSLDEISRQMSDVERRLNLGRMGERLLKREDQIIASLDELIKKVESQSGGGGGGNGQNQPSSGQNQSGNPADESRVKGSTAPGETDKRNFKPGDAWGNLQPRKRAQAREQISRDYPAHYRDAIEQYTRRQANRAADRRK